MSTHTNHTALNQVYLLIPPGEIGYAYVYVANASAAGDTYFDDLIIEQKGLDVIQTTDYYPFGYVMKRNGEDYCFGYQGEFAEDDGETGWNHFELREYDPVIGRWMVMDPERQFSSSYLSMANNPENAFDPDGGYVYIIGTNGQTFILNSINLMAKTTIGTEILNQFINSETHHVFISSAPSSAFSISSLKAGNVTTTVTELGLAYTTSYLGDITTSSLGAFNISSAGANPAFNVFNGLSLPPEIDYWNSEQFSLIVISDNVTNVLQGAETMAHEMGAHTTLGVDGHIDATLWGTGNAIDFFNLDLNTRAGKFGAQLNGVQDVWFDEGFDQVGLGVNGKLRNGGVDGINGMTLRK